MFDCPTGATREGIGAGARLTCSHGHSTRYSGRGRDGGQTIGCTSRAGNRLFELALGPVALALCGASDPDSQKLIDRLVDAHGPDGFTPAFLRAHGLDWAADLLAEFETARGADVPAAASHPQQTELDL